MCDQRLETTTTRSRLLIALVFYRPSKRPKAIPISECSTITKGFTPSSTRQVHAAKARITQTEGDDNAQIMTLFFVLSFACNTARS